MAKDWLTDEQVELEIARLNSSEEVQLARAEQRMKYKRRQYLYTLRQLEKRGEELASNGLTLDNIEQIMFRDLKEIKGINYD